MRNEVSETRVCGEPAHREPIAVVGIGCRLPGGVRSAEDFWKLLDEERDAIVDIPADRWSTDRYYESERTPGKSRVRRGGFLTDPVDEFDPAFFGISPIEASSMDPQQRLLLEVAWESIEDAGLRAEELERSQTAVFTGGFTLDYSQMQFSTSAAEPPTVAAHTATGVVMTMLSNRISHAFDLLGPSMSVDTACSSSLVAIHLACQSIWNGESDLALAGGVNLMLSPNFTVAASTGGFLSPTSTSRAFDAAANGYVRGEGAALIVLKPLAQARADGDRVYATVLGTAVSQDGRTNGITVPNGDSQKRAIEAALARAGIAADSVDYVEAHGTGTPVGDPIEATAIGEIYGAGRPADRPLVIGSVKTNLGHLEAAAGVVGFIKSALALAHRRVPRHLHLDTLNPAIDLDKLRIRVATESTPLRPDGPLRAGVNSFGFGGTNAHAILESVPVETRAPVVPADGVRDGVAVVLPLAARSENALAHLAAAYVGVAAAEGSAPLAGALAHRRSAHRAARLAVIAADATEAEDALRAAAAGIPHQAVRMGSALAGARPLAFVYTGMGPQWWGMARGLLQNNSVFRAAIERCDAAITPLAGWSLTAELLAPESTSRMQESVVAQIANFGVQYALTRLWESFGVRPDLIVGHSAGEVAAALEAEAMTFDDAITVIVHRARLQHTASGGGRLLAVALGEAAARDLPEVARGEVEFAAINSPESVALVGALPVLESLAERLGADGVFARLVPGDVPYHSRAMDPLEAELRTVLAGLAPGAPSIPLYSTVTGAPVPTDGSAPHDAEYWWRNIRRPVLFGAAAGAMIDGGAGSGASGPNHPGAVTFLEIGPTAVVGRAIAEVAAARGLSVATTASLRRDGADAESFAAALADLWVHGVDVDFSPLAPRAPMRSLPAYPWQTGRYWSEGDAGRRERLADTVEPYLGNRSDGALPGWRRLLDGTAPRSLADHVVHGATLFPGAGFLEIAAEVARDEYGATACTLQGVAFETALMHGGGTYLVDTSLDADSGRIAIHGKVPGAGRWARHATATLRPAPSIAPHAEVAPVAGTRIDEDALYERFRDAGFAYGPAYRLLYDVTVGDGAASARIRAVAAEPVADRAPILEPSVLDAAFQLLLPLAFQRAEGAKLMPVGVDRVVIHARPEGPVVARATARTSSDPATISGDVILAGDDGRVLAEVEGFTVRILGDAAAAPQRVGTDWVYEQAWEPQPADDAERTSAEGTWLLLADRTDVADRLADRLTAAGGTPVLLHAGAADGAVPPADRAALAAALDRAVPDAGLRGIVHLWSLDASPDAADPLRWTAHEAVLSVMHLATELEQRGVAAPTFLVTDGAQPVAGGVSAAGLLQSTMLGVGRVLHHELSGLQARLVDLDPGDREGSAAMLFDELTVTGSDEDQVAFRDGTRLVARLYPSARSGGRIPARMRPDGAYLVTGGLGALGRLVLVALAERGAGHLIVTSRSGLPARATWDDLTDPAQRDAVVAVRTAEAAGATVHVVAADVTDAAALAACLERLRSGGVPALRGVIHSAGAVDDQILVRMTQEQVERVVRPKVLGAWALHEATAGEPLDFFALFSSISAVIPSPGQGNYAAGNAFLDALAHHRRAQGLPALSINWGPWDAGMIASLGLRELYGQRGIDLIDPVTGMDLLAELLGSGEVQQGVVSAHWPTVIESYALTPTLVAHLGRAEGDEEGDAESILERLGSAAADDRAPIAADGVRLTVSRVLRMAEEHIPDDEPLGRLGVDSMLATELRIRVEQQFRAAPSIAFLLDGATVATIAAELLATLDFSSGDIEPDAEVDDLASLLADLDDEAVAALLAQSETTEPNAGGPR